MPRKRSATVNIRIEPTLKKEAEKAATADQRTLTSLIEKLLADHVRELRKMRPELFNMPPGFKPRRGSTL